MAALRGAWALWRKGAPSVGVDMADRDRRAPVGAFEVVALESRGKDFSRRRDHARFVVECAASSRPRCRRRLNDSCDDAFKEAEIAPAAGRTSCATMPPTSSRLRDSRGSALQPLSQPVGAMPRVRNTIERTVMAAFAMIEGPIIAAG